MYLLIKHILDYDGDRHNYPLCCSNKMSSLDDIKESYKEKDREDKKDSENCSWCLMDFDYRNGKNCYKMTPTGGCFNQKKLNEAMSWYESIWIDEV